MRRNKRVSYGRRSFSWRLKAAILLALTLLLGVAGSSILLRAGDDPPQQIPSYVSWTPKTIAAASGGDAFRGMLLAKRCEHCHGIEGFSSVGYTPNLAGMNNLALWKQLQDFRSHKRMSKVMAPISESLAARDVADLAAYYAKLPVFDDPQDSRIFPQPETDKSLAGVASHLISFGDGERGIPPCQSCHGPVAYRTGVPSLMTQNADYLLAQLEGFANRTRNNDIYEPMRTIAWLLSKDERRALAEYYGAGLGLQPASSK